MTVFLGDDDLTLESGDAMMIPRKTPHRWQNDGTRPAQVLLVSLRLLG